LTKASPENGTPEGVAKFENRPRPSAVRSARKSSLLSVAVTAVIVPGLFATVALPAYAFVPPADDADQKASQAIEQQIEAGAQSLVVDAGAGSSATTRDSFGATTQAELAAKEAEAAAARKRAVIATSFSSFSGPTASDLLVTPPYPSIDLAQVAAVGQKYLGTPYVYGGADPSGFDCSGFIMYVYAQFGVRLPHSVSGQAASGSKISAADALPGDLVIMSGHDGIYMGNGLIMDAPRAGGVVSVRPIWTSAYSLVRIGV
jgi:cell wall-associated NlpC family hydrolase